jgi:hypothetical protein
MLSLTRHIFIKSLVTVPFVLLAIFYLVPISNDRPQTDKPMEPVTNPSNLSWSQIEISKVEGVSELGKISNIHYYQPTESLFMSVIEPDGARCVWRRSKNGDLKKVFSVDDSLNPGDLTILSTQNNFLFVQHTNPDRVFRSSDNGESWTLIPNGSGIFWDIAQDQTGNLFATSWAYNEAKLYQSRDNGVTWKLFKDFQVLFPEYAVQYDEKDPRFKLRHLHGVFLKDGAIYIGTGDVARFTFVSEDKGETWKQIWNEGFTAAVSSKEDNDILFGPDKLRSSGIALFDTQTQTLRETWHPKPNGYAGYTYSMTQVDGVYYVAIHTEANEISDYHPKYGLLASLDGERWYPLLEYGPVENTISSTMYVADGINEIFLSVDGELYSFAPLKETDFDRMKNFASY